MARFIVTHSMAEGTQEQFVDGAKKVATSLAAGAEWLNSWWVAETEKLICEWEAPDAEAVRASLEVVKDLFPVETIHEAQRIEPQWYK